MLMACSNRLNNQHANLKNKNVKVNCYGLLINKKLKTTLIKNWKNLQRLKIS